MPTHSAPASFFSRASALPATASPAPATAAPFSRSRLEIDMGLLLLPLVLLFLVRLGGELLRGGEAGAGEGADHRAADADGERARGAAEDAVVRIDARVRH